MFRRDIQRTFAGTLWTAALNLASSGEDLLEIFAEKHSAAKKPVDKGLCPMVSNSLRWKLRQTRSRTRGRVTCGSIKTMPEKELLFSHLVCKGRNTKCKTAVYLIAPCDSAKNAARTQHEGRYQPLLPRQTLSGILSSRSCEPIRYNQPSFFWQCAVHSQRSVVRTVILQSDVTYLGNGGAEFRDPWQGFARVGAAGLYTSILFRFIGGNVVTAVIVAVTLFVIVTPFGV